MESKAKEKVYIERASPLTKNGIQSMGCSEKEYGWYCKGLEDGRSGKGLNCDGCLEMKYALQEQAKEIYKKYISEDLCDCPVCIKNKKAYFKKYGVKEEGR